MCQMQGQMAVTSITTWCDFAVACSSTEDMVVRRVYFCKEYWEALERHLFTFAKYFREGRDPLYLKGLGDDQEALSLPPLPEDKVITGDVRVLG